MRALTAGLMVGFFTATLQEGLTSAATLAAAVDANNAPLSVAVTSR